jgi:ParB/RepB/Spo0J family partition protein
MKMIEATLNIEEIFDCWEETYSRRKIELKVVDDLIEDIQKNGLKHRLQVRKFKDRDGYEVIDGLHRLRALKRLGWKKIPVLIVTWDVQPKNRPPRSDG